MVLSFIHDSAASLITAAARHRLLIGARYFRANNLRRLILYFLYAGLVALSVKIIIVLWLWFSGSPELNATAQTPALAASQAADFAAQRWQIVHEQDWFGQVQPAAQSSTAEVAETKLNVLLRGIAYGARPAAVIEEGGQQSMYREGDTLDSYPATVGEIFRDHLLLYYQGETEQLSLADGETSHHLPAQTAADGAFVEDL